MSQIKVAVQLASLGLPIKRALPFVAECGAVAVEIDARGEMNPRELSQTGLRQLRKWLDDYNLRVSAVGFRTRRGYDIEEDLERRIAATHQAMRFAYALGTSVVINQVGRIPDSDDDPAWSRLVDVLSGMGRASEQTGAWLAMETGTERGAQMRRLIDALPRGSVTVNFDPGNLVVNGFSPTEAIGDLGPFVSHVHAKDAVRDLAQGRGLEVALGRGSVDFPQLIGTLEEHEYRGYFTIEREQSDDPLRDVRRAAQYLRQI